MRTLEERVEFLAEASRIQQLVSNLPVLPGYGFATHPVGIKLLEFDYLLLAEFFRSLRAIMEERRLEVTLAVLDPDPEEYYYHHFKHYPFVRIFPDDTEQDYLGMLLDGPSESPADAIGINSNVIVIYPPAMDWLIYGDRGLEIAIAAAFKEESLGILSSFKELALTQEESEAILPAEYLHLMVASREQ